MDPGGSRGSSGRSLVRIQVLFQVEVKVPTLFVASTLALVSLCWSGVDNRVLAESDLGIGSSDDENVSGSTVDTKPLFQSL